MKDGKYSEDMTPAMRLLNKYMRIAKFHRVILERRLSFTGVYRSQHKILMVISHNPNISQKELADMNEVSTATIAVSLKKMEKGGYIKGLVDERDNRYNEICIPDKGRQIVEKSHQIFREVEEAMFSGFSEEESRRLEEDLDRIYRNLTEYEVRTTNQRQKRTAESEEM